MNYREITLLYEPYEKYGIPRYFLADRCFNTKSLKEFNKNKILAEELVTFDLNLLDLKEIEEKDIYKINFHNKDKNQILAIIIRPYIEPNYFFESRFNFIFCGYDLVDVDTCISAITDIGALFKVIDYDNLNEYGLIDTYKCAVKTQIDLIENYEDESHAWCEIIEIWRKI